MRRTWPLGARAGAAVVVAVVLAVVIAVAVHLLRLSERGTGGAGTCVAAPGAA